MFIRAAAHFVVAQTVKGQIIFQTKRVKSLRMERVYLIFNVLYGNTAHTADGMWEILADHILINTDCLKDLGAFVGLYGTDPHLGCNLHDTVYDRIVIILHCRIVVLIQHMIVNQLPDGVLCQIGIDRAGPIAQQGRKMMNLPWLPGFQDDSHTGFLFRHYQMTV